jgi:uncharacterized protein
MTLCWRCKGLKAAWSLMKCSGAQNFFPCSACSLIVHRIQCGFWCSGALPQPCYAAQVWNGAELARAFGIAATTVRHYLDILTSALVVRQFPPWFGNVGKRQIKAPKVYISDSGVLHTLLNLPTHDDLEGHPKVGASWEGFVVNEIMTRLGARPEECFFWATHGGAELDLLIVRGQRRLGFECQRTVAPRLTRSMHTAFADLQLEGLDVIHAGEHTFPLASHIRAVALRRLLEDVAPLP